MNEFFSKWWERIKKGDVFPLFIIGAIAGMVIWMVAVGFPWGIIATVISLGLLGFGLVELIWKLAFKKTVSQEFWLWTYTTMVDETSKYIRCPNCRCGIGFPNKWKANTFSIIFIITILIITVGHLIWR